MLKVRAGVCTGDGPCDSSKLGTGKNWVTKTTPKTGLHPYIHAIAHALERKGMEKSQAIATAIATVKRWARGEGKVTDATRARARKALGEWEKLKADNKARRSITFRDLDRDSAAYQLGKLDREKGNPMMVKSEFYEFHPGDADDYPLYCAGFQADRDDLELTPDVGKKRGDWGRDLPGHHEKLLYPHVVIVGKQDEDGVWHYAVSQPMEYFEAHKAVKAYNKSLHPGTVAFWQPERHPDVEKYGGVGAVDYVPRRGMVGEWTTIGPPSGGTSHTGHTGSGDLLPVGPPKKVADRLAKPIGPHKFAGATLHHCQVCDEPVYAAMHRPLGSGSRSAHGRLYHFLQGHKSAHAHRVHELETGLLNDLKAFFDKQRGATLSRLMGKRGKTMLKRAACIRATNPTTSPSVSPQTVFTSTFWQQKLKDLLTTWFQQAASEGAASVQAHTTHTSLAKVQTVLKHRAETSAMAITGTTRDKIFEALQAGVAAGTGINGLADRVNKVFDTANAIRARMIAQTEAVGALNQAAHEYATNLQNGEVATKTWLAHHDTRTRPAHRAADGQTRPIQAPFLVGGFNMDYPGDPVAPPDLVINCRCGVAYMPPGVAMEMLPSALKGLIPPTTLAKLNDILAEQTAKAEGITVPSADMPV